MLLPKPDIFKVRWTSHPVIVTKRDNKDYVRVLYTLITRSGGEVGPANLYLAVFRTPPPKS